MILTCPRCATRYLIDDQAVWRTGRTVECRECGQRWRAVGGGERPPQPAVAPSPEPAEIPQPASDDPPPSATPPPSPVRAAPFSAATGWGAFVQPEPEPEVQETSEPHPPLPAETEAESGAEPEPASGDVSPAWRVRRPPQMFEEPEQPEPEAHFQPVDEFEPTSEDPPAALPEPVLFRPVRPPPRRRSPLGRLLLVALLLLAVLGMSALALRDDLISIAPWLAPVYQFLGLPSEVGSLRHG